MPTIRSLTPAVDQINDSSTKVQVWVSQRDKRRILSAVGDDGVFTFVIRTTFQRLATYIKDNDINSFDPASFDKFVEFVRNGTAPCSHRPDGVLDDNGTVKSLQHPDASTPGRTSGASKSREGRIRKLAVKILKEKRTNRS